MSTATTAIVTTVAMTATIVHTTVIKACLLEGELVQLIVMLLLLLLRIMVGRGREIRFTTTVAIIVTVIVGKMGLCLT